MDSFFSKLRQEVSFHHNSESELEDETVGAQGTQLAASCPQIGDVEVDDFLLLDTDHQTIGNGESFPSHLRYPDSPPTYRQVSESDDLPSYQSIIDGSYTAVSGYSAFSEVFSPMKSKGEFSTSHHNALSDVPFQLHPTLQMQSNIEKNFNNLDLKPKSFDWFKYSYEFNKERLLLRDFISDEMANIDEFVVVQSNTQGLDIKPYGESDNLIQL